MNAQDLTDALRGIAGYHLIDHDFRDDCCGEVFMLWSEAEARAILGELDA